MKPHLLAALFCLFIFGCAADARQPAPDRASEAAAEAVKLRQMLESYFEEFLKLSPLFASSIGDHRFDDQLAVAIGAEQRDRRRALYSKYRVEAGAIRRDLLDPEQRLILAIFERTMERNMEALQFDSHLQPVRQLASLAVEFPLLGAGYGAHPFKTVADYDNFLKRIARFEVWIETAMANMRGGIDRGIVQPRVVIERTLPQLEAMIVQEPERSLFFRPIDQMPEQFGAADRARLTRAYREAIEQRIVPSYRRLRNFIQEEYLPKARPTYGIAALPDGNRWYEYLVAARTTTAMTPEAIFQLGLEEIQRIKQEIEKMRIASGFEGDAAAFSAYLAERAPPGHTSRDDLIKGYQELRQKVIPRLPLLFGRLPKAEFEIRAVEQFRERSSPSQYQSAAPDGSRPGVFYVNAARIVAGPVRVSEALFLHEAIPGHHLQISVQQEQERLPRFRRFVAYNAFTEGWALYAESLGRELGLYSEPYQYLSRLNSELFRAVRLVVDVGLHRKGWTRDQALKFMRDNTSMSESGAALEVDRYIAWPAQALSYKIGQLKITAIRAKAQRFLGARFDIRAFHDELLKDGAMPLDLLESKMDAWVASQLR